MTGTGFAGGAPVDSQLDPAMLHDLWDFGDPAGSHHQPLRFAQINSSVDMMIITVSATASCP